MSPAMQLSDFVNRSRLQTELDSTCSYYHYSFYFFSFVEFSLKMCCTFTVINGSHIHWIFQPGTYASDLLFREESIVQLQSFPYATSSFPIMHLICPPKFCINIVFNFSWDGCNTQEKWKTKVMQNLGGQIRCIMGNVAVA